MGAPPFAVKPLRVLASLGVDLVGVFTRAPKAAGRRGLHAKKTAVHEEAERLGLPVFTPSTLRDPKWHGELRLLRADLAVVVAYGLLLPSEALLAPRLGCFNLHASLLPRWRGAAPIQRAIMAGDAETGVSIMKMEIGLDTGPIAGELRTEITPSETAEELAARLSTLAAKTLEENWNDLVESRLPFQLQANSEVLYARKIDKSEAVIDWAADAHHIRWQIHALSPFPGAQTSFKYRSLQENLKALRAEVVDGEGPPGQILDQKFTVACGRGALRLLEVQRAGRNVVTGADFMRSSILQIGDFLVAKPARPVNLVG